MPKDKSGKKRVTSESSDGGMESPADDPMEGDSAGGEEDEEEYEVEKLMKRKPMAGKKNKFLYLVKWVGWEDPTWEEEDNLTGCEEKLAEFEAKVQKEKKAAKEKDKDKPLKDQNTTPLPPKKKKLNTTPTEGDQIEIQTVPSDLPPEKDAEHILGATDSPHLAFLVKFKNGKNALVEKKICRDKYPRLLCDFLLERVQMTSPEPGQTPT